MRIFSDLAIPALILPVPASFPLMTILMMAILLLMMIRIFETKILRMTSVHCPPVPFQSQSWDGLHSSPSPPWKRCCQDLSSETAKNIKDMFPLPGSNKENRLNTQIPWISTTQEHRPPFFIRDTTVPKTFSYTVLHCAAGELIHDRANKQLIARENSLRRWFPP